MKPYTWAVIQDCRLVGYVVSYSGMEAMKIATKKYGERLFVERLNLDYTQEKDLTRR